MTRKVELPSSPRHVLIFDEDWEYLETRFGPSGFKPVGISAVVRALIHSKVTSWRELENKAATLAMRGKSAEDASGQS